MNWTRYSELAVGALVLVVLLVAGTLGVVATEFDGESNVPDSAEVGTEVQVEGLTLTEPYAVADEWTMQIRTQLDDPRLIVVARDTRGDEVRRIDTTEPTTELVLNDTAIDEVEFEIRGDVPEIGGDGPGEFNYSNRALESINVLELREDLGTRTDSIENGTFRLHRFTESSREARQAIDNASALAEEADSDEARDRVDEAIDFYDSGQFGNAVTAATDAEELADTGDGGTPTFLLVGVVLALLAVVAGVGYYLQSRDRTENKLQ